jgi:ABC-2 type transport system ATP-binding protein
MGGTMEIIIENLVKNYGKKVALKNISMNIGTGMYGLLGANGAGKTTLMRILATTLSKSSGIITIDGTPIEKVDQIRKKIGYLPQEFSLYPGFTVYEIMEYFYALSKLKGNPKSKILDLLEMVNLLDNKSNKVKALSGGMKRRLGIALALLNEPQLLLVDEPTAGLDPEERMKFRNLLTTFSNDRTVMLSTHIIGDVEETCDKLAIIKNGTICFQGLAKDLKKESEGLVWEFNCEKEKLKEFVNTIKEQYILSQMPMEDYIKLRILSANKPNENAVPVSSKLEDSYVKYMHFV